MNTKRTIEKMINNLSIPLLQMSSIFGLIGGMLLTVIYVNIFPTDFNLIADYLKSLEGFILDRNTIVLHDKIVSATQAYDYFSERVDMSVVRLSVVFFVGFFTAAIITITRAIKFSEHETEIRSIKKEIEAESKEVKEFKEKKKIIDDLIATYISGDMAVSRLNSSFRKIEQKFYDNLKFLALEENKNLLKNIDKFIESIKLNIQIKEPQDIKSDIEDMESILEALRSVYPEGLVKK